MPERYANYFKDPPVEMGYTGKEKPILLPLPDGGEIIDLSEGTTPFGPPEKTQQIVEHLALSGKVLESLSKYRFDLSEAEKNLRDQLRLPLRKEIFISAGGSNELLFLLVLALNNGERQRIWGPPGQFPELKKYVDMTHIVKQSDKTDISENQKGEDGAEKVLNAEIENEIVEPTLTYSEIETPFNASGKEVLDIMKTRLIEAKNNELEGKIIVYLGNPNPQNGVRASNKNVREFLRFADRLNTLVIVDEAYRPDDDSIAAYIEQHPNLIAVGSSGKADGLPGEGLGYLVAPTDIELIYKKYMRAYQVRGSSGVNMGPFTNPQLIKDHKTITREKTREIKTQLLVELTKAGFTINTHTDLEVPIFMLDGGEEGFYDTLRQEGVITTRGSAYFNKTTGEWVSTNRFVRMTIPNDKNQIPIIVARCVAAREMLTL